MTRVAFFAYSNWCPKCGEQCFAPEQSEFLGTEEVHHFWCCWDCGNEFETLSHVNADTDAPTEIIRKNLPLLLAA
jgi:hypothetical protein